MPVVFPPDLMVSVSGVRGRVGPSLTPELVTAVAAGFGVFLRREGATGPVVVGRDSRTSGPMLARAVLAGLESVGTDVVDVGLAPTPTILLAAEHHRAAGALAVTASHNPAEWNALKLATGEGMFLDGETSARFRAQLAGEDPPRAAWDALGTVRDDAGALDRHLDAILALPLLDVEAVRAAALPVALDCVRGAGGVIVPRLLESLGCRVSAIHTEPDGHFPRDPEPTAEHLAELGELVRRSRAVVGLAVDPDADRLSLVDESGRAVGEDLTLALAADAVLSRMPGPVVTNLSTSRVVEDVAEAHGARLVRAPVGEIHVARRMQAEGATVGGEGNGGVILAGLHHTRDAPLGVALILQHLVDVGLPLSGAVARWPAYHIVKEKLAFPREALGDAYAALCADLGADGEDRSDGLRLSWERRRTWLHVRPSGTEPVVRLIAEAPQAASARALVRRAAELLDGVV
jgi:phosphomannomutase